MYCLCTATNLVMWVENIHIHTLQKINKIIVLLQIIHTKFHVAHIKAHRIKWNSLTTIRVCVVG